MTSVSRAPESYLSPVHVAEVIAAGGAVLRNDHLGALIRWPGGRVEQYERLPSGELEVTHRDADGEVLRREAWCSGNFFAAVATRSHGGPEAAEEARKAWGYITPDGYPTPDAGSRLLDLFGNRIVMATPAGKEEALLEALTGISHLEDGGFLEPRVAADYRSKYRAALGWKPRTMELIEDGWEPAEPGPPPTSVRLAPLSEIERRPEPSEAEAPA